MLTDCGQTPKAELKNRAVRTGLPTVSPAGMIAIQIEKYLSEETTWKRQKLPVKHHGGGSRTKRTNGSLSVRNEQFFRLISTR